jgi:hypothetical protein
MATEEKLVLTVVTDVNGRRSTDRTEIRARMIRR